ncbi:LysM domain-containing protein, partial [Lawsonibacter hominis]|uniref:LysM peptidoglycan-binding domain-containing protein n=1 Tax=Lawsonibacter hominis TaxID=2763053 RepID=UPI00331A44DA
MSLCFGCRSRWPPRPPVMKRSVRNESPLRNSHLNSRADQSDAFSSPALPFFRNQASLPPVIHRAAGNTGPFDQEPLAGGVISYGDNRFKKAVISMTLCPAGSNSYTVRPGDSLWAIAQRFRTTVSAITTANPGLNANNLLIG